MDISREAYLSDLLSQYTEDNDTFKQVLSIPDPWDSMPVSSTTVMGLKLG